MWPAIIGAAASLGSAFLGSSSASEANARNIKMQREQRAWEEKMSDSAVRRRAHDIELAGGNRALAFTGGQSASTPSVAAPTVEPTFRPEWTKGEVGTAALLGAQLDQIKAQTQNVSAQTKKTNVESQILEEITGPSSAQDLVSKTQKNALFSQEMRKAIADADISEANARLLQEKTPLLIRLLNAQGGIARLEEMSAQQIQALLGVKGADANSITSIIKTALQALRGK